MMNQSKEFATKLTDELNILIKAQIESRLQVNQEQDDEGMEVDQEQADDVEYLKKMRQFWLTFCQQMQQVRDVFLYLERTYLVYNQTRIALNNMSINQLDENDHTQHASIWSIGLTILRQNIASDGNEKNQLKSKLIEGILRLIEKDRENPN